MNNRRLLKASSAILKKTKELGASLSGFASVKELKEAPSFTFAPLMPDAGKGVGTRKNELGLKPGEVAWPENAKTLLVIAVSHPEDRPELDWWFGKIDPPGNRVLAGVVSQMCTWITTGYGIATVHLPYHVEKGGTYLKDASVLAGIGCIGRNNILVTPEYGPRVRLRALALDADLPSTGPTAFNPCKHCNDLCRKACPQKAFEHQIYTFKDYDQEILPGRDGHYHRASCNLQMDDDIAAAREETIEGIDRPVKVIKYCRRCEQACPVGKLT
ncbi:MAG: epoxyqueuosine reductase [Pseudomonadota bacterium]